MTNTRTITEAAAARTRRRLLQLADRIPPLPETVRRLLQITNREDVEPAEIEEVLQHDPILVGQVIMLVNSSLFALNREVTTIREGVVLLGFSPLRSMVLAYSAGQIPLEDYSCYGYDDRGLWYHSVTVAAGAKCLATLLGFDRETREIMFVAGLMHDLGKMLIAPTLNERRIAIPHFPGTVTDMEYQTLGIDHTEASAFVVAKWGLADTVQEVIADHHMESAAPADYRTNSAVLRVADALAHELGIGYLPGQAGQAAYAGEDLEVLKLEGDSWQQARSEMEAAVQEAMQTMGRIVP